MTATTTRERRSVAKTTAPPPARPLPVGYTAVLSLVLVGATLYGLLGDDPYRVSPGVQETLPAVLRGQDLLTLLTVPVLLWASVRASAGSLRGHLLGLGLLLYYAYSYVMYAFSPFNDAFLLYITVIGMSSYGLLNGLVRLDVGILGPAFARTPRRPVGWFLLVVGVAFVGAWLAMIVSVLPGGLPAGRMTYDIGSAVHVLDLAFVLPLVIATGVLLLRGHPAGPVLGAVLLCKIVTLGLAMLFMGFVFLDERSAPEAITWAAMSGAAATWLTVGARRMRTPDKVWLRPSFW